VGRVGENYKRCTRPAQSRREAAVSRHKSGRGSRGDRPQVASERPAGCTNAPHTRNLARRLCLVNPFYPLIPLYPIHAMLSWCCMARLQGFPTSIHRAQQTLGRSVCLIFSIRDPLVFPFSVVVSSDDLVGFANRLVVRECSI
jgi:hypothetical protein